jgi:perosamine synthetase
MKIPLGKPYIKKEVVLKEIEKVLDRRWISGGPAITEFEEAVKNYNNDRDGHYIAIANATVGLEMALLRANDGERYKPDDEVIVPSWSWVASGFAVKNVGAKPVWCDVNNYGVPDAKVVRRLCTSKTKAIIIVHQMGIPCDMDAFKKEFAYANMDPDEETCYRIPIIEDAACAFGSEYKGKKIGVSDHDVVYSFQARKCLTTGEGGMIVTRSKKSAEWYRSFKAFGTNISPLKRDTANYLLKEEFDFVGTNYKICDIQCAVGLAHLSYFDEEVSLRTRAAQYYNRQLVKLAEDGFPIYPANQIPKYCTRYNWQNYHALLWTDLDRDKVVDALRKRDIGCKWDIQAIHLEPAIKEQRTVLSNTELFHNHGLWLPFFAEITEEQQAHVIANLKEVLKQDDIRIK